MLWFMSGTAAFVSVSKAASLSSCVGIVFAFRSLNNWLGGQFDYSIVCCFMVTYSYTLEPVDIPPGRKFALCFYYTDASKYDQMEIPKDEHMPGLSPSSAGMCL
jgi:hypothetical protein